MVAGRFAKLSSQSIEENEASFQVHFNSDKSSFSVRGQALLHTMDEQVLGEGVTKGVAQDWKEDVGGFDDVAEFYSEFAIDDSNELCKAVAGVVESVSGLGPGAGDGICS